MTHTPLPVRTAVIGAAVAALAGLAPFTVLETSASAAPQSSQESTIRAAHLSPDMPGVDIYVTSFTGSTSVFVTDATYGEIGAYKQVPAGTYTFSVRRHGEAASRPPLQTWSLTAKPGYAYTAAEVGTGDHHRGVVLNDNLTPPSSGHGNVRLIQASSRVEDAQVVAVDGPVIARDTAFGSSTGYASVRAGTWTLRAAGHGQTTSARVAVPAGSVTSLLLLDAPGGGIRLTSSVDAAGAADMPSGSIDAGAGGTAHGSDAGSDATRVDALLAVAVAVASVALVAFALRRRRPSAGRT